jgi:hypothetical protein
MKYKMTTLLLLALAGPAVFSAGQEDSIPAYKNTNLSFEERARDLEQRMTLEEKISQLGHTSDAVERLGIPEYNWWIFADIGKRLPRWCVNSRAQ